MTSLYTPGAPSGIGGKLAVTPSPSPREVTAENQFATLQSRFASLWESSALCDVTLAASLEPDIKIKAHQVYLSVWSDVFCKAFAALELDGNEGGRENRNPTTDSGCGPDEQISDGVQSRPQESSSLSSSSGSCSDSDTSSKKNSSAPTPRDRPSEVQPTRVEPPSQTSRGEPFPGLAKASIEVGDDGVYYISHVTSVALSSILSFLYRGSLRLGVDNCREVMEASFRLGIDKLVPVCLKVMCDSVSVSNCLGFYKYATQMNLKELEDVAREEIEMEFLEVFDPRRPLESRREFLELDSDTLAKIMQWDNLCVQSEADIFEALMSWAKYESSFRKEHFSKLLPHVRLPLLPLGFLEERELREPMLRDAIEGNSAFARLFVDAINFGKKSSLSVSAKVAEAWSTPRSGRSLILALAGGFRDANLSGARKAHVYAVRSRSIRNKWEECGDLNEGRQHAGIVTVNGVGYVAGGMSILSGKWLASVEKYNKFDNTWETLAPMSHARSGVSLAATSNGQIYAIGGQVLRAGPTNYVEMYHVKTNEWSDVAPMRSARTDCGSALVDGMLYAIGGWGAGSLSSVEAFDLEKREWKQCQALPRAGNPCVAAAHAGKIYAYCGIDDDAFLAVYTPDSDSWVMCADIIAPLTAMGCAFVGKWLYLWDKYMTVHRYSAATNAWQLVVEEKGVPRRGREGVTKMRSIGTRYDATCTTQFKHNYTQTLRTGPDILKPICPKPDLPETVTETVKEIPKNPLDNFEEVYFNLFQSLPYTNPTEYMKAYQKNVPPADSEETERKIIRVRDALDELNRAREYGESTETAFLPLPPPPPILYASKEEKMAFLGRVADEDEDDTIREDEPYDMDSVVNKDPYSINKKNSPFSYISRKVDPDMAAAEIPSNPPSARSPLTARSNASGRKEAPAREPVDENAGKTGKENKQKAEKLSTAEKKARKLKAKKAAK